MKRIITFLFMTFLFAGVFAQGNAEYQAQLAKAKEFEENRQYINALHCYYEAMNAEPTLEAEEAFNAYNNILEEITAGKPGHGDFDEFSLYDGWYALCIEYEQFWTKHCPYVFDLKLVDDSKLLDMEKRTASYAFEKKRYETYFFTTITKAMKNGMEKSRTKSWKGIPEKWPVISIYHEEKYDFMKDEIALFNITDDGESFFAPMFDSNYYELPNTYEYDYSWYSSSKKPKYSTKYHSGATLYDVEFEFIDKKGNLLFKIPRTLYDSGKSLEFSRVSVENLSPTIMKKIDAGEYEVKAVGIYLEYGRPAWNPSEERSSYTSENRLWMSGLPELTYDIEKQDNITAYFNSGLRNVFLFTYPEKSFVYVEGGTFKMGGSGNYYVSPQHDVTITSYYISKTEITQSHWTAVMGNNPSKYIGDNHPVDNVSWYDVIVFCNKYSMIDNKTPVYSINGITNPDEWNYSPCQGDSIDGNILMDMNADGYRLPTEAEWEFAIRGGTKSKGYKFSGSDDCEKVAWNNDKGTHDVATKEPNELGLYDMNGNVTEWCWDWFNYYSKEAQINPTGGTSAYGRITRGYYYKNSGGLIHRSDDNPSKRSANLGFRLAHSRSEKEIAMEKERLEQEKLEKERLEKERQERLEKERIEQERIENERVIKNLLNSLVYVEGGSFKMGSTSSAKDEKPAHTVTLSSYCMAQTEITQEQWRAVMNSDPSMFIGDVLPVEYISWYDAIVFCNKLSILDNKTPVYSVNGETDPDEWGFMPEQRNTLTGEITMNRNANGYRLPTEAEWEYAAKGGNKSKGYKYSGSTNTKKDVAWYEENSNKTTHTVATKSPNELGLYDMSGNVWEWCWDWYGPYSKEVQTDPTGPVSGVSRVTRGGSYDEDDFNCRVATRSRDNPTYRRNSVGFRIVRSTSEYETIIPPIPVSNSVKQEEPVKKNDEITFVDNDRDTIGSLIEDDYFPMVFSVGFQTPYENLIDKSFDLSEFLISASWEIHSFFIHRSLFMFQVDFYYPEGFDNGFIPLMNLNLGLQFGWKYGVGLYGGVGCAIPGVVDDIGFLWKWTGGVRLVINRVSFRGEISCLNNSDNNDKKYMIGAYIGFAPFHMN